MAEPLKALGRTAILTLLVCPPARAADLIEPWEPGFSDLEVSARFEPGVRPQSTLLLGFGLPADLSLGLAFVAGTETDAVGLSLTWTRDLGSAGHLDLFLLADGETGEYELGDVARAAGFEWSAPFGRGPYLRWTALHSDGTTRHHPLIGLALPFRSVELHFELSSEQPSGGGAWPIHFAVGPNWRLGESLEILPELSILHDRRSGETTAALTIVLVTDPRALIRPRSTP